MLSCEYWALESVFSRSVALIMTVNGTTTALPVYYLHSPPLIPLPPEHSLPLPPLNSL